MDQPRRRPRPPRGARNRRGKCRRRLRAGDRGRVRCLIVERSAALYTTIKLIGAACLVWLGVRTFRRRRSLAAALDTPIAPKSDRRIVRDGFVVGITNPKAAVFFAAILPESVDSARADSASDAPARARVRRDRDRVATASGGSPRGRLANGSRPRPAASRRSVPPEGSCWSGSGSRSPAENPHEFGQP